MRSYLQEMESNEGNEAKTDAGGDRNALARIERRLLALADEAFDEEEAVDSDGTDQAERQGILSALAVVREELA
jgi:hypothetical protein